MQAQSFLTELIQFKDEIFKSIRLLENRITTDMNDKYTQSNLIYDSINNRLNLISSNYDSLLELLTSQKLNLDKIGDIEQSHNKIERNIITNELKLKQVSSELESLREKYDKIIYENLQVSGYIGPGCQYKTIGDYIRENILEFSKMKTDKEKIKLENNTIKSKLDNMIKSTLNLVDNGIIRCQKYSDRKHADMKSILENKLMEVNEKNMDLRTLINKAELDNERIVESLKKEVENIQNIKEEFINMTENKINEINDKIETITQDIKALKSMRKEHNNNNIKPNRRSVMNFNMNMFNKLHNFNENKNSIVFNNIEEESVNSSINNSISKRKKIHKEKVSLKLNYNKTNEIIEQNNNNIIKELSKSIKKEKINIKSDENKENEKIISQDNTLRSFEKIIPIIKEDKKEEKFKIKENNLLQEIIIDRKLDENKKENKKVKEIIVDRKIDEIKKENKKVKENNLLKEINIERKIDEIKKENKNGIDININKNAIKNNREIKENKEDNKKKVFLENKATPEKHEFISINDNIDIMNDIIKKERQMINTPNVNRKINEQKNIFIKNTKNVVPTRIKIESQEKQEKHNKKESQALSLSNSSGAMINISNQNILKKDDMDSEIIKSINYNSFHFNENDNINNNVNSIKSPEKEKENNFIPIFHKFQNKDIQNKMRNRNRNMISPTKSLSYYIKSEKPQTKNEFKVNEEQKQVMDNIKSHFNFMKGRQEQKSGEKLVDCNVINLQLNYNKNKRQKNASAKILKNNLSEIGMKLSPAFGRTNYNFFIRNKLGDSYDNIITGLNQKNSLKSGLNAAFVNSIKNKINFNDKGNFFP